MRRMRILVTNDDGIMAPGIEALYTAVADLGDVEVVAPETSQSAVGHAISVKTPLSAQRVHVNGVFYGWSIDGRPADCVKLAIHELMEGRPDFVLSGINAGANTGINVLYSGTVAGAVEAAFFGIPSIAFSLELSTELDFHKAGRIARSIFQRYVASRPTPGTCLSVNIPALDNGWPRGVQCAPQATATMDDWYEKRCDEQNRTCYFLDGRMPDPVDHPDTDFAAMKAGYVAITPLRFDMTCRETLQKVSGWDWPQVFA